jgi:sterol 3beta-glucosyltransferase
MVIPFIADQRFWGARVARLGAGLGPVARRGLSPESLETALRELVENPAYRERAASIARALASEDGPARAVAALPF